MRLSIRTSAGDAAEQLKVQRRWCNGRCERAGAAVYRRRMCSYAVGGAVLGDFRDGTCGEEPGLAWDGDSDGVVVASSD